jgi:hypothetical protein
MNTLFIIVGAGALYLLLKGKERAAIKGASGYIWLVEQADPTPLDGRACPTWKVYVNPTQFGAKGEPQFVMTFFDMGGANRLGTFNAKLPSNILKAAQADFKATS